MTPAEYAQDGGWVGPRRLACALRQAGREDGIRLRPHAHRRGPLPLQQCAWPRASRPSMRRAGVKVGLGVDGSASNDGAHLLGEARQALLLARGLWAGSHDRPRGAEIATLGGACVLGRDDIGALAPDMSADVVAFDLRGPAHAGAGHDPVAALVFCQPATVALSIINGRVRVRGGQSVDLELALAAGPPPPAREAALRGGAASACGVMAQRQGPEGPLLLPTRRASAL